MSSDEAGVAPMPSMVDFILDTALRASAVDSLPWWVCYGFWMLKIWWPRVVSQFKISALYQILANQLMDFVRHSTQGFSVAVLNLYVIMCRRD